VDFLLLTAQKVPGRRRAGGRRPCNQSSRRHKPVRRLRGDLDPEEIVERMLRRFYVDPNVTIQHFARALPPPQRDR
jgi:hypothetical protein